MEGEARAGPWPRGKPEHVKPANTDRAGTRGIYSQRVAAGAGFVAAAARGDGSTRRRRDAIVAGTGPVSRAAGALDGRQAGPGSGRVYGAQFAARGIGHAAGGRSEERRVDLG